MTSKQILRTDARERRAALSLAMPDFAQRIARFADSLATPRDAVIASYWPVRGEADPRALALALVEKGHTILLPRIAASDEPLEFRLWREGDEMAPNRHGIQEPQSHAAVLAPGVVLVPLLAFDADGARLGYGGGYYDRSLAQLRANGHIVAIGIAYAGQEVEKLPHDPHDQRLDGVVTESGIRTFGT